ncbi:MAG: PEP-CTERM sorting domain-containing protein [Acetobacteraceae bacterium]|jgi:hypothetical protein|nr:PEP-CTERM sorting domain-containing protein [Acetobacteraceae bacterium]
MNQRFLSVQPAARFLRALALAVPLSATGGAAANASYWNLFNIEGESTVSAEIVTYAAFIDMLNDTNRTGNFNPGGAADNVVGTGAGILSRPPVSVAEPGTLAVLASGLAALGFARRRRRR